MSRNPRWFSLCVFDVVGSAPYNLSTGAVTPAVSDESEEALAEAGRRRTFAIISHPDAGKTTLTEKLLLYGGQLSAGAGSVKAKSGGRSSTSDWMELEQKRGISISSTVVQFNYRDCVINLLDTPGHRDFSEDTYRVLAATDAAVMVLDAAKGIEPQTRKLFEVCRNRQVPILTFINKWDRPGLEPLELLDEIEDTLVIEPVPITWPVGRSGDFRGILDRRTDDFVRYTRTERGATMAPEERLSAEQAVDEGEAWTDAVEGVDLLDVVDRNYDKERFEEGELSPVYFGSALTNFGVGPLLDALIEKVPAPSPRRQADGGERPLTSPFSGIVFKVQANMDRSHRDRIAFVRVCSGHFSRGMVVTHGPTGRPFATKYVHSVKGQERQTIDDAWPGDVIGLVNANDFKIGDAVWVDEPVEWPPIPSFAPVLFKTARVTDTSRAKQFRSGISQLDEEGVVQVLHDRILGAQAPILGAVGALQFEVAVHRLENEFGAPVMLESTAWNEARRTDAPSAEILRSMARTTVVERSDGDLLALFESPFAVQRLERDQPELTLERLLAGD
jgi:peptide chain release factor 3